MLLSLATIICSKSDICSTNSLYILTRKYTERSQTTFTEKYLHYWTSNSRVRFSAMDDSSHKVINTEIWLWRLAWHPTAGLSAS